MTQAEFDRKFEEIINAIGYDTYMADTLGTFLLAAPGQHAPDQSSVDYVVGRLWVEDPKKGSVT
jgi:hypothetical protein